MSNVNILENSRVVDEYKTLMASNGLKSIISIQHG